MQQENSLEQKGLSDFVVLVENFLDSTYDLFDTPEYQKFKNVKGCLLLKQLYERVNDYYENPTTSVKGEKMEELCIDPEWLEIVSLSKKTVEELKKFIEENEGLYNE